MLKVFLILFGTISLCLGVAGIFIPGLPTTPFLLLTAGMYFRSSDKLYNYVLENKLIGSYIKDFQVKRGMSLRKKTLSISIMWTMIAVSVFFFISPLLIKSFVILAGIIGTIIMGLVVPTIDKQ